MAESQTTTEPKSDDDPHRWEVEPHPYSSDFDYFITDSDAEARRAILEAAEMYLWDGNDGKERTLTVRMNKDIPNTALIDDHVDRARRLYAPLNSDSRVSAPSIAPVNDGVVLVDREVAAKRAFDAVIATQDQGYTLLQVAAIAAANVRNLPRYPAPASTVAHPEQSMSTFDYMCDARPNCGWQSTDASRPLGNGIKVNCPNCLGAARFIGMTASASPTALRRDEAEPTQELLELARKVYVEVSGDDEGMQDIQTTAQACQVINGFLREVRTRCRESAFTAAPTHRCNGVNGAERHGTVNKCTICGEYREGWYDANGMEVRAPAALRDEAEQACPCLHGEPCQKRCTCVNPSSSAGCWFCCTYGSQEQQRDRAATLRRMILSGIEHERAATTPPSTLANAAAEKIAANYEVHKDRCHSNERYPSPPCDCGAINEIAAIIDHCFSAGDK